MSTYSRSQHLIYLRDWDVESRVGFDLSIANVTSNSKTIVDVPFDQLNFVPRFGVIAGYSSAHPDNASVLLGTAHKHSHFWGVFDDTEMVVSRHQFDPEGSPDFVRSSHIDDMVIVKQYCMVGTTPTLCDIEITNEGATATGWSFGIRSTIPSGAVFNPTGLMIRLVVTLFAETNYKFGIFKPTDDEVPLDFKHTALLMKWNGATPSIPYIASSPATTAPATNINGYLRYHAFFMHNISLPTNSNSPVTSQFVDEETYIPTYGTTTPVNPLPVVNLSNLSPTQNSKRLFISNSVDYRFSVSNAIAPNDNGFTVTWASAIPPDDLANIIYLAVGGELGGWSLRFNETIQPSDFNQFDGRVLIDGELRQFHPGGTYTFREQRINIETLETVRYKQPQNSTGYNLLSPWVSDGSHYPVRSYLGRNRNRENFTDPFTIGVYWRDPIYYDTPPNATELGQLPRVFGQAPSVAILGEDMPRNMLYSPRGHMYYMINGVEIIDTGIKHGAVTRSSIWVSEPYAHLAYGFGSINYSRHTTQSALAKNIAINHGISSRLNPIIVTTNTYEHLLNIITSSLNNSTQTVDAFMRYINNLSHATNSMNAIYVEDSHTLDVLTIDVNDVIHSTDMRLEGTVIRGITTDSLLKVTLDITHSTDSLAMLRVPVVSESSSLISIERANEHNSNVLLYVLQDLSHTTQSNIRDWKFEIFGDAHIETGIILNVDISSPPEICINNSESYYED